MYSLCRFHYDLWLTVQYPSRTPAVQRSFSLPRLLESIYPTARDALYKGWVASGLRSLRLTASTPESSDLPLTVKRRTPSVPCCSLMQPPSTPPRSALCLRFYREYPNGRDSSESHESNNHAVLVDGYHRSEPAQSSLPVIVFRRAAVTVRVPKGSYTRTHICTVLGNGGHPCWTILP